MFCDLGTDHSSAVFHSLSKVRRRDNGKLYAVKMMTKERILSNNKRMERAMMERKVLAKARHPFIVTMYWVIFNTILTYYPYLVYYFRLSKHVLIYTSSSSSVLEESYSIT